MSFGIPVRNGLGVGLLASTFLSSLRIGGRPAMFLNFIGTNSLDSRVTFTRASTATFVGSNGLIQSAAINAPRFDYNPATLAPKGLLIEEQRINIFTYSAQLENAAWSKLNVTVTADATTSPDGTLNADKLVVTNAGTNANCNQSPALTASTAYTETVYAKKAEWGWVALEIRGESIDAIQAWFNLNTGAVGTIVGAGTATITDAGNGWYRCSLRRTMGATTTSPRVRVYPTNANALFSTGDGTSGIFVWGAQLEAGAFATSYIPTVASQVTRSADVAQMTGTNFSSWYNAAQGTFTVGFTSNGFASNAMVFSVTDGTLVNLIQSYWSNATTITMDGGALATMSLTAAQNTASKLAYAYRLNDYAASINGGSVTTDTSGTPPPTMSQLNIGNRNGALFMSGHIRQIAYYNTRLPNTTLRALSA